MIHSATEKSLSADKVSTGKQAISLEVGFPVRRIKSTLLPLSQGTGKLPAVVRLGMKTRLRVAA